MPIRFEPTNVTIPTIAIASFQPFPTTGRIFVIAKKNAVADAAEITALSPDGVASYRSIPQPFAGKGLSSKRKAITKRKSANADP